MPAWLTGTSRTWTGRRSPIKLLRRSGKSAGFRHLRLLRETRSQCLNSEVTVDAGSGAYRVLIGNALLDSVGHAIADVLPGRRRAIIISDTTVGPLFAERVQTSLQRVGLDALIHFVPAGENSKSIEQVTNVTEAMMRDGFDRKSFVVGLGGGVIGDLSGFVAAIFHRGIPHVQIPTTLLAMVDSSIGGKTAINTDFGKNLLGAVHQPSLVIDDLDLLKTLPAREFNQGFAEIIKHGIIADAEMFEALRQRKFTTGSELEELVKRNVEIKARIVAGDEDDRAGKRAILNFGHTIGHGIERAGGYRDFFHGEAIALGMVAAARISVKRAGLAANEEKSMEQVLNLYSLPTKLPASIDRAEILNAVTADKKFESGAVRFVVTPKIGSAYLSSDVTIEDIEEAINDL